MRSGKSEPGLVWKDAAARGVVVLMVSSMFLLIACSKSDSVSEAPAFDQPDVATTAPLEDRPDGADPENHSDDEPATAPTALTETPVPVPDEPDDLPPETVDSPERLILGEVDVQTLMPVLEDTVWRDPEYGYVPSESGETPIIDSQVPPPFRMTPVCYDSAANHVSFFISTTEGILCGIEIMTFPEQAEQICSNRSAEGRVVELDPYLKLETLEGDVLVRTTGCAIPVTQEGLDRYVESLAESSG